MSSTIKDNRFGVSRGTSIAQYVVGAAIGVLLYKLHLAQKWDAAVVWLVAAIWYLAIVFESRWKAVSFWISFVISSLLHISLVWYVFANLLRNVEIVGILACIPVGAFECVGLYYLIDFLDRGLAQL